MKNSALAAQIAAVYRDSVEDLLDKSDYLGSLIPDGKNACVEAALDGYSLGLLVDTESHRIHAARYQGEAGTVASALLEKLCELITGLPTVEAYDHGIIKLEFALRGRQGKRPVDGIVLPRNADPMFKVPEHLLRSAINKYKDVTGIELDENFYDPGPSETWRGLSDTQRRKLLRQVIADEHQRIPGLAPSRVHIGDIEFDVRITIEIDDSEAVLDKPAVMRQLEMAIREKVDARLELAYTVMKDNNAIRRLK